jgi:GTP-binding protein
MRAEFITSAADVTGFPESNLPEIAFIGRSNVGKSSMINALLGRKKLVKVGNTPGKTRLINFFNVDNKYMFVDLPGYGYAKVSKAERKKWGKLIENYITKRSQLKACVLIIDCRRIPADDDFLMIDLLSDNEIPIILTATKSDKLSSGKLQKHLQDIAMELEIPENAVIPFSAVKKNGLTDIWANIDEILKNGTS